MWIHLATVIYNAIHYTSTLLKRSRSAFKHREMTDSYNLFSTNLVALALVFCLYAVIYCSLCLSPALCWSEWVSSHVTISPSNQTDVHINLVIYPKPVFISNNLPPMRTFQQWPCLHEHFDIGIWSYSDYVEYVSCKCDLIWLPQTSLNKAAGISP